jgi:CRP-like cAMP-binding protein
VKSEVWFLIGADFSGMAGKLADRGTLMSFDKLSLVDFPDEYSSSVFVIMEGKAQLFKLLDKGSEFTVATLTKGSIYGKRTIFEDISQNTFLRALEPTKVFAISMGFFVKEFAELKEQKIPTPFGVSINFRDLLFKDVSAKVAELLSKIKTEGKMDVIKVNFDGLAELLGTSREALLLALAGFSRAGYIEISGKKIMIKDAAALKISYS